jgi:hypothetical protein
MATRKAVFPQHGLLPEAPQLPLPTPEPGETVALFARALRGAPVSRVQAALARDEPADAAEELCGIVEELYDTVERSWPLLAVVERCSVEMPELEALWFGEGRGGIVADLAEYLRRRAASGGLRVSDADRDRAVSELSEAFQAGRITADEFEQRSAQALRARTGKQLTALVADLPPDPAPAVRTGDLERARVLAARIVMAASAAAAISLAAVALSNALRTGPSLAQREAERELAQQVLARQGISISVPLPPALGFDWAGTITPAVIAVLLIGLIVVLRATRTSRA